jgi:hypothetical protein
MGTKLLTEIERYRELMGVRLLNEVTLPASWFASFAEAFGKSEDDFFKTLGKNEDEIFDASERLLKQEFNDIAQTAGKNLDDFITQLKAGTIGDDILDTLATRLLKSSDETIAKNTVEAFVKEYPSLKMLQSSLNDDSFMKNILKSGDKNLIKDLETLKEKIGKLNLGEETKTYFQGLYDVSYTAAKTEADKIAKEAYEKLVKQGELLDEIIADNTRKETLESLKKTKALDLRKKIDELAKNNKLPTDSEEYKKLTEYIDNLLKESPEADLTDLVNIGEKQFKILYDQYQIAVKEGELATQQFWNGVGKKLLKYLNYANLGRKAKTPFGKAMTNILGYAVIIPAAYFGYKGVKGFIAGEDLTPEELELVKIKVKNNLGGCISLDEITIKFINTDRQSESDVFDPDRFGKAVVEVPIDGVTEKIEFSVALAKFHKIGNPSAIINCETTPSLGVTLDDKKSGGGSPPAPPAPAEGTLTDDQILALWKSSYPSGVKKDDGYYISADGIVGYIFDPTTKTFK